MTQSIITTATEQWLADRLAAKLPARPDTMIFAHIPGQDKDAPIDRNEGMPEAAHICYETTEIQFGVLNENAFVSSVILDSTVGDWRYNWIGLADSQTGTVLMIVHVPEQEKIKTQRGVQGNTLTRNLSMQFSGAAEASQITVTAQTWQIDFSARLIGIDEAHRLANCDLYGRAAFFDDGFLVERSGARHVVTAGVGYISGLRASLNENMPIDVTEPTSIWADVSYQGSVTSHWKTIVKIKPGESFSDYVDSVGFEHYVFAIARIDERGEVTDLRPKGSMPEQVSQEAIKRLAKALAEHEQSRNHPDATLQEKGLAQYSDEISDRSDLAATPAALKALRDAVAKGLEDALDAMQSAIDNSQYPIGSPIPWMMDSLPEHGRYAFMTGQAFDKAANPILAKRYPSGRFPDARGRTIKFTPQGRAVLSLEEDGNKRHGHTAICQETDLGTKHASAFDYGTKSTAGGGLHDHDGVPSRTNPWDIGGSTWQRFNFSDLGRTDPVPEHGHTVYIGPHAHDVYIGPHGHIIRVEESGNEEVTVKSIAFNCITRLG